MLKEYVFKLIKEEVVTAYAIDEDEARDLIETESYISNDETLKDIELVDVYEYDPDNWEFEEEDINGTN